MKVPTARKGKAYPKRSTDGFMGAQAAGRKMGSTSDVKLGQQLVKDSEFYDPTVWTAGAGWTVGNGVAIAVPAALTAVSQATHLFKDATDYQVELEMTANAGTVTIDFTGGVPAASAGQSADNVFTLQSGTGNTGIAITKDAAFDGSIFKLVIREIIT